jgi:predicted Rossmann fold flavoprotein
MAIAIIGAGPSGIAAALQASWAGAQVTLFERNLGVGRKLLVTGSGRCNITNAAASGAHYTCGDTAWMDALLASFGVSDLIAMLHTIGIPVVSTSDGWYYPLSNTAQSVVDAFANALVEAGVTVRLSAQVTSLRASPQGFSIHSLAGGVESVGLFDRVILAAGGKAYPTLGSRGELFPVLEQLGHTVLPKRPALAPVLVDLKEFRALQGVRLDAGVTLWQGKQCLASTAGNLIFTEWGLNGPAVMDLSHHISARPGAKLVLALNLLKFFQAEFDELLNRKRFSQTPLNVFLGAFFPPKVAAFIVQNAHLPASILLCQVEDAALLQLVGILKDSRLGVKGVRGFEYCQVSAGGVPVNEVNPQTLESRRVPGLYLVGEMLDVVGPCGGYNLQFAFSSGALAGKAAAEG